MFFIAITFLMGDMLLQTQRNLSVLTLQNSAVLVVLLIAICILKWRGSNRLVYILISFVIGFYYSFYMASNALSWTLPKNMEGKIIEIKGSISSLPVVSQYETSFIFQMDSMGGNQIYPVNLRLTWRDPPNLMVGDNWKLFVSLRRIHGLQNPGGFDYEAYALQSNIRANGYVTNKDFKQIRHDYFRHLTNQWRQLLQEKIENIRPYSATSVWLPALIIGERTNISSEYWDVLRRTGTNHLMAIAGLHIGLIAGMAHLIFSFFWRRMPFLLTYLPAQFAGGLAGLVIAVIYSAMAGFSIPTQRAVIMYAIYIIILLSRKKINPWDAWGLALIIVLLFNPLVVLSESFWLSFITIAIIILGMSGRLSPSGWWWKWGRVQWVIGLGLIPISLFFFQQSSLISFVANSIAIPWLGFFVLPFCLLSCLFLFISTPVASFLLLMADISFRNLWALLNGLSSLNLAVWTHPIPSINLLFLTMIGMIFLLLPRGFSGKFAGIFFILPLLFYQPKRPHYEEFTLTLLDVGQGLSAVVETKNHVLIFDAGPKFGDHFDMGESVVLPFLRLMYYFKIDTLVVSHGDNDHIGGVSAMLRELHINKIHTSVPEKLLYPNTSYCLAGTSWQWDGVTFKFLYPTPDTLHLTNDSSCVLKVDNGKKSILLTGDIEKFAENNLLTNQHDQLASTIIIAPHHGSKTSGVKEFIQAVHPQLVLYPTGYRNRYRFPHQQVVHTYDELNINSLNTAITGAIQVKMSDRVLLSSYRENYQRYWFY